MFPLFAPVAVAAALLGGLLNGTEAHADHPEPYQPAAGSYVTGNPTYDEYAAHIASSFPDDMVTVQEDRFEDPTAWAVAEGIYPTAAARVPESQMSDSELAVIIQTTTDAREGSVTTGKLAPSF